MKLTLFHWEECGRTLVVTPEFDGRAFRYHDLQVEANAIRAHMLKSARPSLVIDLERMDYFGSEFVGAVISLLRETTSRGGWAGLCSVRSETRDVLRSTGLLKLWPLFETRAAALAAADLPDSP